MAETDYRKEAIDDAESTVEEFLSEIVDQLYDNGEASDDLQNDYPTGDSYHHESHVDRSYTLLEAAQVLDQLSDHEETDAGLWEGLEPRRAVEVQAAFTYGNAVYSYWKDTIEEINADFADADILTTPPEGVDEAAFEKNTKEVIARRVRQTAGLKPRKRSTTDPHAWDPEEQD